MAGNAALHVPNEKLLRLGERIASSESSIAEKMRICFTLLNIGGEGAVDALCKGFHNPSVLLKHEICYVLGQMQLKYSIPFLVRVLEDKGENGMVRHEAGEALGAIGDEGSLAILDSYSNDAVVEVAETCQLASALIRWRQQNADNQNSNNKFTTVDPAPALKESANSTKTVAELEAILVNEKCDLFQRYRAMFSLRDIGTGDAVLALAKGFQARSALMRHEIAYVFGQLQHPASVPSLKVVLENDKEKDMVRHEAAEALGSIAMEECTDILKKYEADRVDVVRESCLVALDISDYNTGDDFQYADGLVNTT